jgi:integrase/recombinase XerD
VQEAASHADPRTTMRYDRARGSLDRHAPGEHAERN